MAHNGTVLGQFLKLVSRHEFEREAVRHHRGRKLRSMSRWSQFVAMATAQLSGRCSLRDIVSNLDAQAEKLYHLGARRVARTSLARDPTSPLPLRVPARSQGRLRWVLCQSA